MATACIDPVIPSVRPLGHLQVSAWLALMFAPLMATLAPAPTQADAVPLRDAPFDVEEIARFEEPWASAFLPDGRLLVTERPGKLYLVDQKGKRFGPIAGLPEVDYGGQGGLGDVIVHPGFATNQIIYLSYAEMGSEPGLENLRGAAVARARLVLTGSTAQLEHLEVIWRQVPKLPGRGHFGHRLAFDNQGFLYITSGERQAFTPAQDLKQNLGKIIRLHDDGSVPEDNPFADAGEVAAQVWTLGHRNPLGIAFDASGTLWVHEMGPKDGDELNRIVRGSNYGYPVVSNGDHYNGNEIPDHSTRPDLAAPALWWAPAISPAGFAIYRGNKFRDWQGSGFIGGLSSKALIRVIFDGTQAKEAERFLMKRRIREVEEDAAGDLWLLEDGRNGRLLRLTPR
ncbi:MAG: PQQ-dependent sugar dehydrogenase [Pseudomonadales bacterium]